MASKRATLPEGVPIQPRLSETSATVPATARWKPFDELSRKFTGGDYGMGPTDSRVILFVDVERVHKNGY